MNNKYEVLLLLNPNTTEDKFDKTISKVESILSGKLVKKEEWGIKKLAYKIKKQNEAYFILYYVETASENIDKLRNHIAIEKDILRSLILRHEKKWPFEYKGINQLKFPERKIIKKEFSKDDNSQDIVNEEEHSDDK